MFGLPRRLQLGSSSYVVRPVPGGPIHERVGLQRLLGLRLGILLANHWSHHVFGLRCWLFVQHWRLLLLSVLARAILDGRGPDRVFGMS